MARSRRPRSRSSRSHAPNAPGTTARTLGLACGSKVLVGSPETVAEQLLDLHRETGVRGFMFLPVMYDAEQIQLMGEVFPYLQKANVWTPPAERGWSW